MSNFYYEDKVLSAACEAARDRARNWEDSEYNEYTDYRGEALLYEGRLMPTRAKKLFSALETEKIYFDFDGRPVIDPDFIHTTYEIGIECAGSGYRGVKYTAWIKRK